MVRAVKRTALAGVILVGNGIVPIDPDVIRNFYLSIYPSDPVKSQALELCFLQDQNFNRLDSKQRDACYQRALATAEQSGATTPSLARANPVDLRRAAAAGSMPRNDIRRLEQTEIVQYSRH